MRDGDCVRMEVDMDSTPRTVQFFVNGESGECFVSGLPLSVRIAFTVSVVETFLRIDRIAQQERPTPITPEMTEIKCPFHQPTFRFLDVTIRLRYISLEFSDENNDSLAITEDFNDTLKTGLLDEKE
ncbi:hypothetical protein BLNAU_22668 [Blattamonas nauphoetae]|uniref:Uncharacterized protein n=1 Tax=Blattamonas nauphoetae TaxID=2049346 RepID=A0ABQ9WSG7_9EUKA|nr:hypothetical protein BLNAU_22668 [Blattamonas nauphoetae]